MLPVSEEKFDEIMSSLGIVNLPTATIRQICALSAVLEKETDESFVHLELGNPGLPPENVGMAAEIKAITEGIVNRYPNIAGIPQLKKAGSDFLKAFLGIDLAPEGVIPTVGSMQGSFTMMLLLGQRQEGKDTMLFIHPGFPAQYHQAKVLGLKTVSFDLYDYRGDRLKPKLREILSQGNITGIIYSNPNNPAWTNLTEEELQAIGETAEEYDAIVIEDLAYMGMDFRKRYGHPYEAPYIPTVARYTGNYVLLVSASKIFSYAGQRIAIACIGDKLRKRRFPALEKFYEMPTFGEAYVFGVLYTASSGTTHSAQFALTAMFEAACKGELDFVAGCSEYAERAKALKDVFARHGFHIVYTDGDRPVSDGFFFTVGYPGMSGERLQRALLRYGIASIALSSTGSTQNGIRVCVSVAGDDESIAKLDKRLELFEKEYGAD